MDRPAAPALLDRFAALEDPRQAAEVLYPSPEVLLLLLCATLAGADDLVEIGLWGDERLAFLRRSLPCRHGSRAIDGQEATDPIPEGDAGRSPRRDTLGEVVAALDPELVEGCVTAPTLAPAPRRAHLAAGIDPRHWTRMPRSKPFAVTGTAELNAMIERVAPAILGLLADGVPRTKGAIVETLAGRHAEDDVALTLIRLAVTGQVVESGSKYTLAQEPAPDVG